jgi:hypothetical protein
VEQRKSKRRRQREEERGDDDDDDDDGKRKSGLLVDFFPQLHISILQIVSIIKFINNLALKFFDGSFTTKCSILPKARCFCSKLALPEV